MRDHLLGFAPLAHLIADAHEPERKPMRTPERVRITPEFQALRAGHDRRETKQLPAPVLLPATGARLAGLRPEFGMGYGTNPADGCDVDHALDSAYSGAWSDALYTGGSTLSILANPQVQAILAPAEKMRQYRNGVELIDGHVYEIEMSSQLGDGRTKAFSRWEGGAFCSVTPDIGVAHSNRGFSGWLDENSRGYRPFTVLRDTDAVKVEAVLPTFMFPTPLIDGEVYEVELVGNRHAVVTSARFMKRICENWSAAATRPKFAAAAESASAYIMAKIARGDMAVRVLRLVDRSEYAS